jgi:hypothetical protein
MTKRKRTKTKQTILDKILHRKLKIEQNKTQEETMFISS